MFDIATTIGDELHHMLRTAAAEGPIAVDANSGAIVVLRYEDVERLAFDRRFAGVGLAFFDLMGITEGQLREWYGRLMFTNEGDVHHRLRSLVARAFTPRAVEALRADTAGLAAEVLAPVLAEGGGDLVAATALLPARVMCRLLGVPDADVAVFGGWADALSPVFGFMTPQQREAADSALAGLLEYVDAMATARRRDPADDLISALLVAEDEGDRLDHAELVDMVANLLVGGHDTTASQLGCTLLTLVRHPEELDRLHERPELVASAVSETIRFEPSIPAVPRTAAQPVDIGGTEVGAGSLVMLSTAAANRQAGVWDDPDSFDVTRFTQPEVPRLLTFGAGPHFCLGAALARLTVEETVRATLDLGPKLRAAGDPFDVPWRSVLGRSPVAVPVVL